MLRQGVGRSNERMDLFTGWGELPEGVRDSTSGFQRPKTAFYQFYQ
jgi:hypothetical protein